MDADYGPNSQRPDLSEKDFILFKKELQNSLQHSEEELRNLERQTINQSESGQWLEERRKRLTASNFGQVCCKLPSTGCENLVKQILYSDLQHQSSSYGTANEERAIAKLEETLKIRVERCGFFVDRDLTFLGATPDGLIDNDGIVEVKCPSSAEQMSPESTILKRKVTFWKLNKYKKIDGINRRHKYYSRSAPCNIFAIWTPVMPYIRYERIERDDLFWEIEMVTKLSSFYFDCLLPELVDTRYPRSMPIRNPDYIGAELTKKISQLQPKARKMLRLA